MKNWGFLIGSWIAKLSPLVNFPPEEKMRKLALPGVLLLLAVCAPLAQGAMDLTINGTSCTGLVATATTAQCAASFTQGGLTWLFLNAGSNSPGTAVGAETESATVQVVNNSGVTQTVTLAITAPGFTAPTAPPSLTLFSQIGGSVTTGVAGSTLLYASCVNPNNSADPACPTLGPTATATETAQVGPTISVSNSSFNSNDTTNVTSLSSPYELGEVIVLTLQAGEKLNFSASTDLTPVPEPASVVLLGTMLLGTTSLLRKRFKRT
jgi:hypothetical protein